VMHDGKIEEKLIKHVFLLANGIGFKRITT
jgi:hypothetical protein